MFERFSPASRRGLRLAREAALDEGTRTIGLRHLRRGLELADRLDDGEVERMADADRQRLENAEWVTFDLDVKRLLLGASERPTPAVIEPSDLLKFID